MIVLCCYIAMKIGSSLNFKITLISPALNFRFSKFSSADIIFSKISLRKTVCQNVCKNRFCAKDKNLQKIGRIYVVDDDHFWWIFFSLKSNELVLEMSISNHHTCLLCSSSNPLLLSYIVEHRVLDIVIIIPVISSNFIKDDFSRAEPILLLHTVLKFNFSSSQSCKDFHDFFVF